MPVDATPPDWTAAYHSSEVAHAYDRRYRGPIRRRNNERVWTVVRRCLIEAGGGAAPPWVIDAPAGTGRFSDRLRVLGCRVLNLDRSATMLAQLRAKHGAGHEVVGDLLHPPCTPIEGVVVLNLRLMQHLDPAQRIAALRGLRQMAARAVVAYYPGWDWKNRFRRLRHRLRLPVRLVRESIPPARIRTEVEAAGWCLRSQHQVFPLLSENVLLVLEAKP